MRAIARAVALGCLVSLTAAALSGCIVWERPWWSDCPPRTAAFHVYVYDYYSGVPLPWAGVELYRESWWSWSYLGTWSVSPYGYAFVSGGYLGCDGGGYDSRAFRIVAFAQGYYTESCTVSVDYYSPSRTVRFYLAPWPLAVTREGERAPELPEGEGPPDRVRIETAPLE